MIRTACGLSLACNANVHMVALSRLWIFHRHRGKVNACTHLTARAH